MALLSLEFKMLGDTVNSHYSLCSLVTVHTTLVQSELLPPVEIQGLGSQTSAHIFHKMFNLFCSINACA